MFGKLVSAPRKTQKIDTIDLMPKPLGMNVSASSNQLAFGEFWTILNWVYTATGSLMMRPGLTKHTNTSVEGSIEASGYVTIGGSSYMLVVNNAHKLYYLDSSEDPVYIGQLEGKPAILQFSSYVIFCDGGYIKYWDGTTFGICYDDGDGTHHTATQFDNVAGTSGGTIALGDATSKLTRVGYKFTSQSWASGYSIPITQLKISIQAEGTLPATTVYARLRRVSDGVVVSEKTALTHAGGTITDAGDIPGTQTTCTATFTSSDITVEMEPGTAYYASFEWPGGGGDDTNHIKVHYSAETAGLAYTYTVVSGWAADTTRSPLFSLYPGMPYKASDALIETDSSRAWFLDASTDGNLIFTNVNDPFDTSTDAGGGYININSMPVGAILAQFGDIYAIGTEAKPFFAKITGTGPSDYAMLQTFDHLSAGTHSAINAIHDSIFANRDGIFTLAGVEQYADLRFSNIGQPIKTRTDSCWDPDGFAAYNANTGEYVLKMTDSPETFIGNMNLLSKAPEGIRVPWTMASFGSLTPTCFAYMNSDLYVGMDDGHLYKWDDSVLEDDGVALNYVLVWPNVDMLADEVYVRNIFLNASVYGAAGTFYLAFDKAMPANTAWASGNSWVTGTTWADDTYFRVSVDTSKAPYNIWIGYRTRQFQMSLINVDCGRIYLAGAIAEIERMKL